MFEFSNGFIQDMASLLEMCMENETDNLEVEFDFNGTKLNVDITFSIGEKVEE